MGRVADRLDTMTVTVTSPDGQMKARVKAGTPEALAFRRGAYTGYDYTTLEHQLGRTATLCYTAHQRTVRETVEEFGISVVMTAADARTIAQREYHEDVEKLQVVGPTENVPVVFGVSGPSRWRCSIADGALDLPEQEFIAATLGAARDLLSTLAFEKAVLKNKHLGAKRFDPAKLPNRSR